LDFWTEIFWVHWSSDSDWKFFILLLSTKFSSNFSINDCNFRFRMGLHVLRILSSNCIFISFILLNFFFFVQVSCWSDVAC
jgi:hypothetical protein